MILNVIFLGDVGDDLDIDSEDEDGDELESETSDSDSDSVVSEDVIADENQQQMGMSLSDLINMKPATPSSVRIMITSPNCLYIHVAVKVSNASKPPREIIPDIL